ncbi:MAG: FtsX-like permease family protein [Beijerinckiaceae bacterium]|jgi:putative ABC transport system permease protein
MSTITKASNFCGTCSTRPGWRLLPRFALRDLRGGLGGFGIFLGCIALGVAAITGVGSVAHALSDGLASQGRIILGGDVSFDLVQRPASPEELAFLASKGTLSQVSVLRGMARRDDGNSALVEIKAVGSEYPSAGTVILEPPIALGEALGKREDAFGIAADAAIGARLGLKTGDRLHIGGQLYELRAILEQEPDKLAAGIGFGPRVLMSKQGLEASGLVQPGSLVRNLIRVTLPETAPGQPARASALKELTREAAQQFPEAGWEVRTRENVSPEFSRDLGRFTQFLTLAGLTALIIGGAGVANAIRGFVERKRPEIAILKALGATGTQVFLLMLLEVTAIALVGIAAGAVLGAAMPFAVAAAFARLLPFPLAPSVYPLQMLEGFLYGGWTALAFSLPPLGRVHDIAVPALFRDQIEPGQTRLRLRYLVMTGLAGLGLAATILLLPGERMLAIYYMAATAGGFILLRLVAAGLMAIASRMPHPRSVALRLAVANIHRPGALTPSVVLSLGLGLGLLVCLTLIDGNIRAQLHKAEPGATPSFFFLDVQSSQAGPFRAFLQDKARDGKLEFVPMMRGRITAINGRPSESVKPGEKAAWVLRGDRGITFAADLPAGSKLLEGAWWTPAYAGPPLVSLEADIAAGLGLHLGDTITVNVSGRNITAKIANTRKVDWRTFGINFVLVFSPGTFAGAPYTDLATVTFPNGGDAARELALLRETAKTFPSVTSIRVRDALDAVANVVAQLAVAIRGVASVALAASVLVLAGALAAGQQARLHDAVVLKTLGATRKRLLAAFRLEYGMIGLVTAVFGVLAGTGAAYGVVTKVMQLDFVFFWPQAILSAGAALLLTIGLGLAGTWRILGRKPAPYLRNL